MKVYQPGYTGRVGTSALMVQPGKSVDTSEFRDELGNAILFRVEFVNGVAKVPANLGRWLVDQGYARKSPIILPDDVKAHAI